MDAERSDEALMLAYAAGEAEAFEPLYARHRGPLFRFILRQVRVQATAEELFQDVWQKVITARERYRPEAKFSTWLYQVATNRLTDHWRAAGHRPTTAAGRSCGRCRSRCRWRWAGRPAVGAPTG